MCASDLEIPPSATWNIWFLTASIVSEKAQTVKLFNRKSITATVPARDSRGQNLIRQRLTAQRESYFSFYGKKNVYKPITVPTVSGATGMLLILQDKNKKNTKVTEQCNLWSQQTGVVWNDNEPMETQEGHLGTAHSSQRKLNKMTGNN